MRNLAGVVSVHVATGTQGGEPRSLRV